MSENKFPGLFCATEENDYQILSDARYLYFVRLGKVGDGDVSRAIAEPEEFTAEWGNVRMPKSGVESVRCTRVRGEMVISIARGEQSYRFVAAGDTAEILLMDVFSNMPMRMTVRRSQRAARVDRIELGLFVACFALAVLQIVLSGMLRVAVSELLLAVGWMLIPLIWLGYCARRARKKKNGITLGVGLMAALFSCVFLWLTPAYRPDAWTQALPVMGIVAAAVVTLYGLVRGRFGLLPTVAIALVTLLLYTPGATLCLNELLPANKVRETAASVVELTSEYDRGDYVYYAVVESESGQTIHQVTRDEYDLLEQNNAVTIITTTGALGIEYTDLRCGG